MTTSPLLNTITLLLLTLDDLNKLRGVMRSFIPEPKVILGLLNLKESSVSGVPELFHVMSRFVRPEVKPRNADYIQTLEAYFMVMWKASLYFSG